MLSVVIRIRQAQRNRVEHSAVCWLRDGAVMRVRKRSVHRPEEQHQPPRAREFLQHTPGLEAFVQEVGETGQQADIDVVEFHEANAPADALDATSKCNGISSS